MTWRVDNLYELVFEGLSEATALHLAKVVMGRPMASPGADEGVVSSKLSRLEVNARTVLPDVCVLIYRYGDQKAVFDVTLLFSESCLERAGSLGEIMDALHEYAMKLAQRHQVKRFFAGLDPAWHADTRFFTGTSRGPC